MSLASRLSEYVRACFTGIWIESHEHSDALTEIASLCRDENWQLACWDIEQGLVVAGTEGNSASADPLAAVRAASSLSIPDGTTLLVLQNFHRFLQSAEIVQAVAHQVVAGRQNRVILIILAPTVQLPVELEKQFVVFDHALPDRNQLAEIARGIATESGELPEGADLESVLDAAAGLTRMEAENAFSLALVRHGCVRSDTVWELKSNLLKTSGLVELHRGAATFGALGGLDALKAFCKRSLLQSDRSNPLKRPRGVLLLGVPGTGKSAFAKALGQETSRPTLILDVGALMGSLVGQTESNVRQALQLADAMSPCILFVDEIEKALSGVASSGQSDSGVSTRLFGTMLTWLNDHTSDVYFIATCNNIAQLPPEFSRAERFDGLFFLDLPTAEEKAAIWDLYLEQFQLDRDQRRPTDESWTGAEIRSCCRLAALLDIPLREAARNIVPVSVTAAESVDRLRQWSHGRCLSATQPGLYRWDGTSAASRRQVQRDASLN
ncbi:AAA family ATPase [Maioricimonas sp. JC845]|uniref:AAA family ATPase n=1 Tax=Maioricimonas sp. JC845 TaxID=3232138 RepID=UPI003458338F